MRLTLRRRRQHRDKSRLFATVSRGCKPIGESLPRQESFVSDVNQQMICIFPRKIHENRR